MRSWLASYTVAETGSCLRAVHSKCAQRTPANPAPTIATRGAERAVEARAMPRPGPATSAMLAAIAAPSANSSRRVWR